jgi:hypothetical protein
MVMAHDVTLQVMILTYDTRKSLESRNIRMKNAPTMLPDTLEESRKKYSN